MPSLQAARRHWVRLARHATGAGIDPSGARDVAPDPRWRGFLNVAAATFAILVALVVGRVMWFDAYWVFRERPPWLAVTGGANRLLDRQMRRAKTLQVLTRRYSVALLGSSTVYHGLDPDDVDPALRGTVYNVGISALLAEELPIVASVVASRGEVDRVVLGLDYFMFSRTDAPVALDRSLEDRTGRWNRLLGSVISRYALLDSDLDRIAGGGDPGRWTYYGFRITPPLPPALTRQNDARRRETAAPYRPEMLQSLDATLAALAGRRLDLYLSPVSDAQRRVLSDAGLLDDFARWRRDVARIAAAHEIRFADLVDIGAAFPFDPNVGSTDYWLDNLHFTPALGRMVLQEVGLRAREPSPVDGEQR
jgi:hypothetical protein